MSNNSYFEFSRIEMTTFLPTNYSKVLEIGCGTGNFSSTLAHQSESWGVEQNIASAQSAKTRLDKVLTGYYDDVCHDIPDEYFDLLICNDVIEHINQYDAFLNDIKNKLSDDGVLVLSIPNVRFLPNLLELLFLKDWRYRDAGILDKTHLRFFTKKSLIRTLNQTGWTIEKIDGINRYGNKRYGLKRILSFLGQLLLGFDTAYLQFGVRARKQ